MDIKHYGKTDIGKKRKENQDSILMSPDLNLFAVADGMGGHKGGSVASSTAIEALQNFIENNKDKKMLPEVYLESAFQESNSQVYLKSQSNIEELTGMGTTLVAAMIHKQKIYFGNVGDSRAYLFRDPYLWRVTEDHSVVNEQIKRGLIEESKASMLSETNIITRSIGFLPDVEIDIFQRELKSKDTFILCSDGLTEMLDDKVICEVLKDYGTESVVDQLINRALDAGGNDNVSVIVVAP